MKGYLRYGKMLFHYLLATYDIDARLHDLTDALTGDGVDIADLDILLHRQHTREVDAIEAVVLHIVQTRNAHVLADMTLEPNLGAEPIWIILQIEISAGRIVVRQINGHDGSDIRATGIVSQEEVGCSNSGL